MEPNVQMDTGAEGPVAEPIGLVGLGLMGMALAERLLGGGCEVWGHDVDRDREELLRRAGGKPASSAAEVASTCRRTLLSLPDSDVVETVLTDMDLSLTAGRIIIDTSTGDPERVAAIGRRLAERGVWYLDATISGSSQQVREGHAVVLAGGPAEVFDQCQDVFERFARRWFHLGPCGSGSQMKLVSNLVLGLNRAALAEGLWFGEVLGLDPQTVLAVLRESLAYSRIMDTKGEKMVRGDFEPQARLSQHHKDVRLMLLAAAAAGTDLPLTRAHARLLELAERAGYGAQDNSAIIRAFEQLRAARTAGQNRQPGEDASKAQT
ncbi:MAG: NAD(P)-dependent oxidoreductase [Sedimentisphaerales bacterium]|nr:NAD(P)-dependent oxidoreductase [Sedimentisphaerales bacterium]